MSRCLRGSQRDGRAVPGGHPGCLGGNCPLMSLCHLIPTLPFAAWSALKCFLLTEQCISGFTFELTHAKLW